jgi:hypothetical protein
MVRISLKFGWLSKGSFMNLTDPDCGGMENIMNTGPDRT